MKNYEQFDNVSDVDVDIIDNGNFGRNIDEGIISYKPIFEVLEKKAGVAYIVQGVRKNTS